MNASQDQRRFREARSNETRLPPAGLLGASVALSLLPDGPWLLPMDLIAIGLLVAGTIRSAQVLFFRKRI
jgi:hypothetical protein